MAQNRPIHFLFIGILVLVFGIIFAFSANLSNDKVKLDEYLCIRDATPPQHDIVLVDATDTLSSANMRETRKLINDRILKQLPKNGRLTIISFTGDVDGFFNGTFTRCNPGKDANQFYENPEKKAREWRNKFINVLDGFLTKLENIPTADSTPLLEVLQIISADSAFSPEIEKRRIFIISDLLQSHGGVSFYKSNLNFENEMKKSYFSELEIDLKGVEIILLQVERTAQKDFQGKKQRDFWKGLFIEGWNAENVGFHKPSRLQPLTPITEEN